LFNSRLWYWIRHRSYEQLLTYDLSLLCKSVWSRWCCKL
jgi:hypothetical protein